MKNAASQPDPLCPSCATRIVPGDPVYLSNGEIIHLQCEAPERDVKDVIANFLKARTPRPFCHTCLSAALGALFDDIRKATAALRLGRLYRVEVTECDGCEETRVTIRAELDR